MGQYWLPVNISKREFIHPHKLECGLKLCEQLGTFGGTAQALIVLLAAEPEERGGGDLRIDQLSRDVIGRWAGDRVALIGDYAEDGDLDVEGARASQIYRQRIEGDWTDITDAVKQVLDRELHINYASARY